LAPLLLLRTERSAGLALRLFDGFFRWLDKTRPFSYNS